MPEDGAVTSTGAVSRNPATGAVIERFAFQTRMQIEDLLDRSHVASQAWRRVPIAERARLYARLGDTLLARRHEIAPVITAEMGKTLKESRAEVEKMCRDRKLVRRARPRPARGRTGRG